MKHLFKSLSVIALGLAALQAEAKFKVVTTFTVIHEYEPTPKDIVKAQSADLILWNGLNLERWFERFFQNIKDKPAVVVTEGITPLSIYEGPYKDAPNPHAWMSPSNALIYVENIKNALVKYDPQNADAYQKNAATYAEKIKQLDKPLREKLAQIPADQRWLVTSEGAFSYLAKDYDLKEGYLWPINAEQQGTPQQVRKLIDLVKKNHIPVVFSESTVSAKPAQQVAKESGAKYGGVLYVDSLSAADGPVPTYIDLLNVTVSTIVKGFEK